MLTFLRGLRAQFLAGFAVAALFAAAVCGLVIHLVNQSLADLDELQAVDERNQLAAQVRELAYKKSNHVRGYLLYGNHDYFAGWEAATAEMDKTLERLLGITRREENRVLVRQMMEAGRAYDQFAREGIMLPARAARSVAV
ncbi:MAG: CHASE3 domain-containing protein, partial [Firmicutes bacterium]|nr:CHASE3 domain-containing protein [Bacillota bacterium]